MEERIIRKKFVIERGILNLKSHFQKEKAMSPEEREIRSLMRPFARFQSLKDHEELVKALLTEVELKQAVEQVLLAKDIGCQNLEDLERLVFDSDNSAKIDRVVKQLKASLDNGDLEDDNGQGGEKRRRNLQTLTRSERGKDKKSKQKINEDINENAKNYNLYYNEDKLCNKLKLDNNEYLLIKELIIRECVQRGKVNRRNVKKLINLDGKVVDQIFDFLIKNEWIIEDMN